MPRYEVIESRVWKRDDGATASPYGATPWESEREKSRWTLVTRGYTVRDNVSNTVGIGRQPWPTRGEADAWAKKANDEDEQRRAEGDRRRAEWAASQARNRGKKKSPAQLQREIDESLAASKKRSRRR